MLSISLRLSKQHEYLAGYAHHHHHTKCVGKDVVNVNIEMSHYSVDGVPHMNIECTFGYTTITYTIITGPMFYRVLKEEYHGPKTGRIQYELGAYDTRTQAIGTCIVNAETIRELG